MTLETGDVAPIAFGRSSLVGFRVLLSVNGDRDDDDLFSLAVAKSCIMC